MKLTASASALAASGRAQSSIIWPQMELPPADPRFGMTSDHAEALQQWYSGVQVAVSASMSAMGAQIETLKSQLSATTK